VFTVAGRELKIAFPSRTVIVSGVSPEGIAQAVALIRQSQAVRTTRALLGRTRLDSRSFEGRALLLTQILLASLTHAGTATVEARSLSPRAARLPLRVGYVNQSCWDDYVKRADGLMQELAYCINHPSWWNPFPVETCEIDYGIHAEAAFADYAVCEGA